jgi:hypothetical protein
MSIKWLLTTPKGWLVLFILIWLVTAPISAAAMVHKGMGIAQHVMHSGQTFLSHL